MRSVLTILILIPLFISSQSLTNDRVKKLKNTVGKILIEGDPSTGTGFFVNSSGSVLTCWHVIFPALEYDSTNTKVLSAKRIFIQTLDGQKRELSIPVKFIYGKINEIAVSNDFCLLSPLPNAFSKPVPFLKIGNFDNISEGDEIYTAGYPLGIDNQFISKGILSTKYIDSSYSLTIGKDIKKIRKSVALLDLTINRGNSGGPIIKIGKTFEEDEVIGIADFLLNPFGENAQKLVEAMNKEKVNLLISPNVSLTESLKLFSKAITYSSNGISGCVSINYFLYLPK